MTGVLDVTVETLRPQIEGSCYGAIAATRAVHPAGTGTVLYTTEAGAVVPTPWAGAVGAAGTALHNWALNLNGALADKGVHVGHVALGAWIAGTPALGSGILSLAGLRTTARHRMPVPPRLGVPHRIT